jgi:hypothetical protein
MFPPACRGDGLLVPASCLLALHQQQQRSLEKAQPPLAIRGGNVGVSQGELPLTGRRQLRGSACDKKGIDDRIAPHHEDQDLANKEGQTDHSGCPQYHEEHAFHDLAIVELSQATDEG